MPEVHVFFGIRNKSNPEPEKQQIHAAVVRHAGPDHQLSDGSYRYGIDVASLSFNREAKVLTLNTAEDDESLSQRLLQPLSNALGRRCLPYKDILNFSIAGRDIMTKGGERPLIYKIV